MSGSNYLVKFLYDVDILISEINKFNSKKRLYKANSEKFGIEYDVRFSISPDYFIKLRDFLQKKIEHECCYDRNIVNVKREFSREVPYIKTKIQEELIRINYVQEKEMNKVVRQAIYDSKIENENKIISSLDCEDSLWDKFVGRAKYRKLAIKNHELKKKVIAQEFEKDNNEKKTIFELVNMIENEEAKSGELLCIQDEMIKFFMIDRNVIKRDSASSWKMANIVPTGFFNQRAYYRILNKNLEEKNVTLKNSLKDSSKNGLSECSFTKDGLMRINAKLAKILKGKMVIDS